jgi:quercetin dioxygenase-like cupin family protein
VKKHRLKDFARGWIIGDFDPSIIRTKDFEFMVRHYQAGDTEQKHIHKIADEITVIVSGIFKMNGEILEAGDIIHLTPGEPADFECLEDGANAVIKTPSVMGDKYLV